MLAYGDSPISPFDDLPPPEEWNIYSRELQGILAPRGKCLASLYQEHCIHPQIVKRLIDALGKPGIVSVLSPENNRLVADVFGFSDAERARLRAAILATAVYGTVSGRVPAILAHAIADQAFLIQVMHIDEIPYFERGTPPPRDDDLQADGYETGALYNEAVAVIERAQLALHLSQTTNQSIERIARAWQAYQDFNLAWEQLHALPHEVQASETWRVWLVEAAQGRQAATEILER